MKNYLYEFEVKGRGYIRVSKLYNETEKRKENYVINYLLPAVREANCGWNAVDYRVMVTASGIRTEFLVLWAEEIDNSGSRWINVTGESLGSIMCSMCDNLW